MGRSNRVRSGLGVLIVALLATGVAAASVHDASSSRPHAAVGLPPAAPPSSVPVSATPTTTRVITTTTTATTTVRLPHTL